MNFVFFSAIGLFLAEQTASAFEETRPALLHTTALGLQASLSNCTLPGAEDGLLVWVLYHDVLVAASALVLHWSHQALAGQVVCEGRLPIFHWLEQTDAATAENEQEYRQNPNKNGLASAYLHYFSQAKISTVRASHLYGLIHVLIAVIVIIIMILLCDLFTSSCISVIQSSQVVFNSLIHRHVLVVKIRSEVLSVEFLLDIHGRCNCF